MNDNWYSFCYKNDTLQATIGRVQAFSLSEVKEKISIIKKLPVDLIDNLFLIKLI
jgi:hypothetical protein